MVERSHHGGEALHVWFAYESAKVLWPYGSVGSDKAEITFFSRKTGDPRQKDL